MNSSFANYYQRSNSVSKNIQAFISLVGITCNILSILVFEQKKLKKFSYSIYWKTMSIFDSLILLNIIRHWIRDFLEVDIDLISPSFCRLSTYLSYVAGAISMCLESLIIFDRFFIIVYPNRFKIIKERRFQITAISLSIVYCLLINVNLPLNYRLDESTGINGTLICHVPIKVIKLQMLVVLLHVLISNVIINPILDIKIIYRIISTRGNVNKRLNRLTSSDWQFAVSAIGLNMNSLFFKLVFLLCNLLPIFFKLGNEQIEMIFSIGLCVMLIERVDIFFINMIVNSTFREEFLSMFGFKVNNGSSSANSRQDVPLNVELLKK